MSTRDASPRIELNVYVSVLNPGTYGKLPDDLRHSAGLIRTALMFVHGGILSMELETHRVPDKPDTFSAWTIRDEKRNILGYIRIP